MGDEVIAAIYYRSVVYPNFRAISRFRVENAPERDRIDSHLAEYQWPVR
jgi:hypothetical protein